MKPLALLVVLAACRAQPPTALQPATEITLYRDVALVTQRIELRLPATPTTITVEVAGGASQLSVLDRGGVTVRALHVAGAVEPVNTPVLDEDSATSDDPAAAPAGAELGLTTPIEVTLDVSAPHAGSYALTLFYATTRLPWDADYTITTTAARDRAVLHGAIAVRNTTGRDFEHAAIHVVDAELATWRARSAEHLGAELTGGQASTTPAAIARSLGVATLVRGETRVELTAISAPRPMHAVLVYDPIGTKLDNAAPEPSREPDLGVEPAAPTKISESFEIYRDDRAFAGLPAGPVRLLERHADGSLGILGEARMFDAATRVSEVDTIAIGTAEGVTGHRERREITIDDARRKLTEEFVITLENKRGAPVGVLVREHMYRGQNWGLAFDSTKRPSKEGAQQISLRTQVAANGEQKILYVVVYTWTQ
ncbi:hypothetical protein BH11MYX1_BH11MYX1_36530 [soil metagenome]